MFSCFLIWLDFLLVYCFVPLYWKGLARSDWGFLYISSVILSVAKNLRCKSSFWALRRILCVLPSSWTNVKDPGNITHLDSSVVYLAYRGELPLNDKLTQTPHSELSEECTLQILHHFVALLLYQGEKIPPWQRGMPKAGGFATHTRNFYFIKNAIYIILCHTPLFDTKKI